ncbi:MULTISPECIES: DUF4160 domain-containing protein [Sanguibacteroides]|uniref:DUF4160 domain-containing protein n=1 Tax=Sanguibacteroides justesenii TaxID=1547597 RepID=A0AB34R340_9PORP|nr:MULTISPECIES: DUF4160 domain-containing protein [Sanguibacteroides]KIO45467.1 hypothetical protein IE90_08665 [Sanguibacteroides justesenii]
MPTLFILFGLRFFFWSREHRPIHVHVENSDGIAKFQIDPEVILIENKGIKNKDVKIAEAIIEENREIIIERWKEFIGE